jgi:hypothetical protein
MNWQDRPANRNYKNAALMWRNPTAFWRSCGNGSLKQVLSSRNPQKRTLDAIAECPLRPSRPGEFHPEPLTDPDLTLSRHPARATARRLPPSVENWSSSCCQLARPQRHPFAPRALHPLRHYYRAVRPSPAHRYFRGWSRLRLFPWHRRPGSHVPYKSQIELRAASMPDAAWAVSGHPPN